MIIEQAATDAQIADTFPVMRQLRPHLDADAYVQTVRRQETSGYVLVSLTDEGVVRAAAGFRVLDQLVRGRVLYVDDLVTDQHVRSRGYGDALIDWLIARAKAARCSALELDSGVQRHGAHRFYMRKRLEIAGYHFVLRLEG